MTPDNGGGALGWLWAGLGNAVAVGKEVWAAFIAPGAVAYFAWRKRRDERADAATKERRTEEERRDAEWKANLDRAGAQVQAHVKWQEERVAYAEAKLREAEAKLREAEAELDALREKMGAAVGALREERWKLLGSLNNHRHALANARHMVNALERRHGQEVTTWQPLDET